MKVITYQESCNKFFAPLDEIIEALENGESLCGLDSSSLNFLINSNQELEFYVNNFNTHVE